ncbi:tRNA 2-selenouridine(34) synthase MnmH [Vallitalea pronyensis]|uniref:tRNA 2-selenouridine(34) synthase MnmH n=1 Tax=Vallitalea pronyensis TaxID=1348613 RepID=A0A8J8SGS3_9FIRM|nr:tRNA 2-selenouridine(34) synthase MnmH [Vallitalea pronyensis]QUI22618.1 tRNA 2-selenouridine(34) synthase MnmH [Vallitalea pronyensis]
MNTRLILYTIEVEYYRKEDFNMNTITIDTCLHMDRVIFIDVRSPLEYAEDTIPGAINIPVFDNDERAMLGHTYKNISKTTAKENGFDIACHKLPDMYQKIKTVSKGYSKIVIFCWRGGMRSKSIATVMSLMHLPIFQLEGGYKAYRHYVLRDFERRLDTPSPYIVLHGYTGCGKTLLLKALEKAGMPVLDLEGLAHHRGSVFGGVGLGEQPSQKAFETAIYNKNKAFGDNMVFVEAESTKIGKRTVPAYAMHHIKTGIHVMIHLDKALRIQLLIDDYMQSQGIPEANFNQIKEALSCIKSYLSNADYNKMVHDLETRNLHAFVSLLLDHYYDPMYKKWKKFYGTFDYEINSADLDTAVKNLIDIHKKESSK